MNDPVSAVMDSLVPAFDDEQGDWSDVVARAQVTREPTIAPARRASPRRSPRNFVVALGSAATAAAIALAVSTPWKAGPTFLARASAALAPTHNKVLHERFETLMKNPATGQETRQLTEIWLDSHGRFRGLLLPGPSGQKTEVGKLTPHGKAVVFDPATNTIGPAPFTFGIGDPAAAIRDALAGGRAKIVGKTTINGRAAEEVRAAAGGANMRIFIDAATYAPLEATYTARIDGAAELRRVRFLVYRQLPATPANLRLANIKAEHPHARLIP